MKFRIGFFSEQKDLPAMAPSAGSSRSTTPVKSLVQVYFPARRMTLAYYNDAFDLRKGDTVFVDGKLEGLPGQVVDVSRSFKIMLSDYKRVIALADTDVRGTFLPAGSNLITFDRDTLPPAKVRTWFLPPEKEEDGYITGQDDRAFPLDDLSALEVSAAVAERGQNYYAEDRVRYLSLDGSRGYAIVEGSKPYEVEFTYRDGMIGGLLCPCYCSYPCKHQVALILQLRESLKLIDERYAGQYAASGCFALVSKTTLLSYAMGEQENMTITLARST